MEYYMKLYGALAVDIPNTIESADWDIMVRAMGKKRAIYASRGCLPGPGKHLWVQSRWYSHVRRGNVGHGDIVQCVLQ